MLNKYDCCSECTQRSYKIVVKGRLYNNEHKGMPLACFKYDEFYMCQNCMKKLIKKNYDVGYLRFGEC